MFENGRADRRAAQTLTSMKLIETHDSDKENNKRLPEDCNFEEYIMQKYPENYLFQQLPNSFDCKICMKPGDVRICSGKCGGFFHRECFAEETCDASAIDLETGEDLRWSSTLSSENALTTNNGKRLECATCLRERMSLCFICAKDKGLTKCSRKDCECYYHVECLEYWPQHKVMHIGDTVKSLMCPRHVCHICIADDPHRNYSAENDSKLTKCLLCPAAYHRKSTCIPAGSELRSNAYMLCPRHCVEAKEPVNIDWCFFCDNVDQVSPLINCETCPAAFHHECLKIEQPVDTFNCIGCVSGRLPLYGEIVWVKYSNFIWWPGMLICPLKLPTDIATQKPGDNYMCVRFFATYDYGWVCQGRVYLYQIEDTSLSQNEQNDEQLNIAIEEAFKWTKLVREKYGERKVLKKPPQYIKIKMNHPVMPLVYAKGEKNGLCDCLPADENPCGPGNQCANYEMSLECTAECRAEDRCQNRRFEKRIHPKVIPKYFNTKGWGLVTLENIPRNTFIIEYLGEVIDTVEFKKRFNRSKEDKSSNFYYLHLEKGMHIDAAIRGNEARFINHSCEPNCNPEKWVIDGQTRIGFIAAIDIPMVGFQTVFHSPQQLFSSIQQNTEITFSYDWDTKDMPKCECLCGMESCSGFIGRKIKKKQTKPNQK